uniref:Glutathione peroxidase n=1 Tax=Pectinaria gouldii TaxID=260746 RepID=A0A0K1R074_PECGU|nr:hypothetical protein [Pectinaria gouldii]
MNQEPWPNDQIKSWAKDKYNVQFDMFAKIKVNGDGADPLYKYLKNKQGGTMGSFIKWNFSKFLVDENGIPVQRYGPNVNPSAIGKDLDKRFSQPTAAEN